MNKYFSITIAVALVLASGMAFGDCRYVGGHLKCIPSSQWQPSPSTSRDATYREVEENIGI